MVYICEHVSQRQAAGSSVPQRRSLGGAHFSFYHGAMSNYSCTDRSVSAVGEEKGLL